MEAKLGHKHEMNSANVSTFGHNSLSFVIHLR